MFANNDISIRELRLHSLIYLCPEAALLEDMRLLAQYLVSVHMVPALIETLLELLVQAVVDGNFGVPGCVDNFLHVLYGIRLGHTCRYRFVQFPCRMEKLVIWVDEEDGCILGRVNWVHVAGWKVQGFEKIQDGGGKDEGRFQFQTYV